VTAEPLRADEAVELSELLVFCAEVLDRDDDLDDGAGLLAAAGTDLSGLRSELLTWAMRLGDTPAERGLS
jgi:hypothetical protein